MTTARRPPQKPLPKITRPLRPLRSNGKKPQPDRPLLTRAMNALSEIIKNSDGRISKASMARDIGRSPQEVVEWTSVCRYAPNAESLLLMLQWGEQRRRGFLRSILS